MPAMRNDSIVVNAWDVSISVTDKEIGSHIFADKKIIDKAIKDLGTLSVMVLDEADVRFAVLHEGLYNVQQTLKGL